MFILHPMAFFLSVTCASMSFVFITNVTDESCVIFIGSGEKEMLSLLSSLHTMSIEAVRLHGRAKKEISSHS